MSNSSIAGVPGITKAEWRLRLAGLAPRVARMVDEAAAGIDRRRFADARRALVGALALAPNHPEVLRLHGVLSHLEGRYVDAVATLREALSVSADDALILNNLGSALRASGEPDAALAAFARAAELAPSLAAVWFNLGKTLKAQARVDEARTALDRATSLAPDHLAARIVLGDTLKALGEIPAAAASYRAALMRNPRSGQAWFALANLKTVSFTTEEAAILARGLEESSLSEDDRIAMSFAHVKALEDAGQHADAFAALGVANARKRRQLPWDAGTFSAYVDAIADAFGQTQSRVIANAQGGEVIFVVSMPRSGSTLVEQILAAHPEVEGASELPDLPAVIEEESRRRGMAFPGWAADTNEADWSRLGARYLERTRRWRTTHPKSTDKGLLNWQLVGAALAMLPGARVVVCRRDPVETSLSCFRQLFARGQEFSYDLKDIAHYWRDFDRLCRHWLDRYPGQVSNLVYEDLLADADGITRSLLDHCGLAFDPACLRSHEASRSVRTASAAQVREPLRQDTARADRFGTALDGLRHSLRFP